MKRTTLSAAAALSLMLCGTIHTQAQNRDTATYNESVIVVGDYKPVLDQYYKINVAPRIVDTATGLQHTFQYNITPRRLTSVFQPTRIKAAKIVSEPTSRLYNNYLRFGLGNYWSGLLDGYYMSTRDKHLAYGARFYHNSSWGSVGPKADPADYAPTFYGRAPYSETQLSLFGRYIIKDNIEVSSSLDYTNDYTLLYGFSDSTLHAALLTRRDSISRSDYRSAYNHLAWNAGVRSLNTDINRLGYEVRTRVAQLWGHYQTDEFNASVDGTVHYGFPLFSKNKGIAYLHLRYERIGDHLDSLSPTDAPLGADTALFCAGRGVRSAANLLTIHPYVDFHLSQFKIHAGLSGVWDGSSDTLLSVASTEADRNTFCLFPDVVVSTNLLDDAMSLSAGFTGGLTPNTWNALRLYNPYWIANTPTSTLRHYDIFGHMRFNFSKRIELNAHAEYSTMSHLAYMMVDTSCYALGNVFTSALTDADRLRIGASLTVVNDEMLQAELAANYYAYFSDLDYLPYMPQWDASLKVNVNFKNQLLLHLQTTLMGKTKCGDPTLASVEPTVLPMRYGLGVEAEYIHTRAISFFLRFDNMLAQRYYLWQNYPSRRFMLMGGLTYTIPTRHM